MSDTAETMPPDHLEVAFDRQDLKRRSVQGGAATLGAQGLKFAIRFGSAIAVARLLNPAAFGLVAMVSPILGFVSTLNDLGFGQAIVRAPEITPRQISALFWRNMLLSLGLAGILAMLAPLIGRLYHEPRTINVTIALGGLLVLSTLGIETAVAIHTARVHRSGQFDHRGCGDDSQRNAGLRILGAGDRSTGNFRFRRSDVIRLFTLDTVAVPHGPHDQVLYAVWR
jgi:hypothetical protein